MNWIILKTLAGDKPPVIHQLLIKRWNDINGNSRGAFRFFVQDKDGKMVDANDLVRSVSPQFKKGRNYDWIIAALALGANGVAKRTASDFLDRFGAIVRVEIME